MGIRQNLAVEKKKEEIIIKSNVPSHVAIIMDGNRRWAKKNGLKLFFGHKRGVETFENVLKYLYKKGVKILTVYAFSTENWKRDKKQVDDLMNVLSKAILEKKNLLFENSVVLNILGNLDKFPMDIRDNLNKLVKETKNNTGMILNTALNYGGRDEIIRAVKKILSVGKTDINEENFGNFLDTKNMPDPDIIIRTGGDNRLSNFLLWQGSYSEVFFVNTLWPDFGSSEIDHIFDEYVSRKRNFGK